MDKSKDWTISQIEKLTEADARELALEHVELKGHDVYFVDFDGYFGYSALVFLHGGHIYHANDYELHHRYTKYNDDGSSEVVRPTRAELREAFHKSLEDKLYTEAELLVPSVSYARQEAKEYYLRNYYPMQKERISLWFVGSDDEREKRRKQTETMFYSDIAFAWFYDRAFVEHLRELYDGMIKARAASVDDFEFQVGAFLYELYNHEYSINWQGDYDVFSCFGNVPYKEGASAGWYMDKLKFTETQKRAFYEARRKYYKECEY